MRTVRFFWRTQFSTSPTHQAFSEPTPNLPASSALCSSCWGLTIWIMHLAQAEETLGIPKEVVRGYCQHVVVPAVGCAERDVVQLGLFLYEFPTLFYRVSVI